VVVVAGRRTEEDVTIVGSRNEQQHMVRRAVEATTAQGTTIETMIEVE